DWTCHDLLSSLGLLLLWLFERSEPLHQQELALFMKVCDAALGRNAGTDFEDLESRLAGALVVRELGADSENAIRLQSPGQASEALAEIAASQVPVYLAQHIRRLLTACRDMEAGFRQPAFVGLNRQLLVELRMLATGARVLRVYRVEALSRVLAD